MQITDFTDNSVFIACAVILLICIVIGAVMGFLRFTIPVIALAVAIVLTSFAMEPVFGIIKNYTPVYYSVKESVEKKMLPEVPAETTVVQQVSVIDEAPLPQVLKTKLLENNNSEIYDLLGVSSFVDYVGSYTANLVVKGITFLVCVILIAVLIRLIAGALHIVEDLPVVHGINKLAGALLGAATGVVIIWIGFVVITIFVSSPWAKELYDKIDGNAVLKYAYEKSIFLPWLTKL